MEHAFLNIITVYLEDNNLLPQTMIEFKRHRSTQEALLQRKNTALLTEAILGLAFDNVRHDAILKQIDTLNVGIQVFDYILDFLMERTTRMPEGQLESDQLN